MKLLRWKHFSFADNNNVRTDKTTVSLHQFSAFAPKYFIKIHNFLVLFYSELSCLF